MPDREVMSALGEAPGFPGKLTEKVDTVSVKVDRIESTMATKAELQAV